MDNVENAKISVRTTSGTQILAEWKRYIPSLTSILLLSYWMLSLLMNGDFHPFVKRGFFCDDSTINYPFKIDTVGIKTLLSAAVLVPALAIKYCDTKLRRLLQRRRSLSMQTRSNSLPKKQRKISGEVKDMDVEGERLINSDMTNNNDVKRRHNCLDASSKSDDESLAQDGSDMNDDLVQVPLDDSDKNERAQAEQFKEVIEAHYFRRKFGEAQLFIFGVATTMLFTGIGKMTVGRFRPHFLQRCQPDIDCSHKSNMYKYIEDFTCTNRNLRERDISYIATSWPSGHASLSFFSAIYLIIYLHSVIPVIMQLGSARMKRGFEPLLLYASYVFMLGSAGYISLTRISDYHHHPTDVFSGCVLGTIIAVALSSCLSHLRLIRRFSERTSSSVLTQQA